MLVIKVKIGQNTRAAVLWCMVDKAEQNYNNLAAAASSLN